MKILHVTKKYPNALGGDAVVVANLQWQQELAGHKVAILTSNCPEIDRSGNVYTFGLQDQPAALDQITPRRLASLLALLWKSFTVVAKERPDIIHTHSIDMAFCVSLAARFYRVPMVHTFHIVTFYNASQSKLRRKAEILLARKAGLKAATAPNLYDVGKLNTAGLSQAKLLPNGVDLDFWHPNPDIPKEDVFTFVSVGRIEGQKGYDYLLQAVALLKRSIKSGFRIVIIGEGGQTNDLKKLAKSLGIERQVKFAGRMSPPEVRDILWRANAAVFASLYETTPLTLLEAWATGTPVISTRVGILNKKTSQAARLVPIADANALAKAMQQFIAGRLPSGSGLKEVQRYDWPVIGRTAQQIYEAAL